MSKRISLATFAIVAAISIQLAPAAAAATPPAPCSVLPTVSATAVTNVTATGADVGGTVNPNNCATSYQFEYGGTTAYGATSPSGTAGSGVTGQTVSATLSGLSPDTTYHVRLVATSSVGPSYGHDASFTTPVSCAPGTGTAPAVVTSAPSGVTATDATLRGTVNPNACTTTYYFQYGPTTAYGSKTGTASAGAGSSARAVTAAISGLAPATTYHARLVATSAAGVTTGPDVAFSTAVSCAPGTGAAPAVVTGAPSAVTLSSAKLAGTITPHGCATTYRFEYGPSTAYGSSTAKRSAGSGTAAVAASASISGLAPATTYHVRLVATSAVGTTDGNDVTFTTAADCKPGKAPAPGVLTGGATAITTTTATLTGAVDPHGCATTYEFQYGPTTAYGSTLTAASAGAGTAAVPVSGALSGLAARTVFHYRLVAVSATGTVPGADRTFRTKAVPPPIVAVASPNAAVVRGYVLKLTLGCTSSTGPCQGAVRLFHGHRRIGSTAYTLSPGATAVVSVRLNGRGRRLFRFHRVRLVEVVARGQGHVARRYVTAARRFRP